MKLLLVDDDDVLVGQLASDLVSQNYVVDIATDGLLGWEYATAASYDLVVLDIDLPGLDGVSLCQRLRQTGYAGPILLLTGRSSSTDKVQGLNAGADDYLVKPYTLVELTARIRALLRRPPAVNDLSLRWGSLQLDPNAGQVTVADRLVVFSPKEYGLLELFLRYPDRIFSNTVLLERLWNADEAPGEETIRTHIKRLRRKLKQAGVDDMVENVYSMGYRLRPLPPEAADALGRANEVTSKAAIAPPTQALTSGVRPNSDALPPLAEATAAGPAAPDRDGPAAREQAAREQAAREQAIAAFERFRPAIDDRLRALHQAAAALNAGYLPEAVQATARAAAHKLTGSLGLFGFMEGSHLARQIEDWLQQPDLAEGSMFAALVDQLGLQLQAGPKLAAPDPAPDAVVRASLFGMAGASSDRYQVLAVDDDPAILAQLQRLLPPWGLDVVPLDDPRQVWDSLATSPPDLVLLDLDMPHLSGLDLCQQLRQGDRWQTLPVLFLTACRDPATIYQLYQTGADDYLPKPILEPELINRLFQRLERGRLLQTLAGTDPLTGLANRQKGTIELDLLLHLAQRYGQPLSLVRVEVDQPAPIAKALMNAVGQALVGRVRSGDAIACWSKSEILVGVLDTDLATAQAQIWSALESALATAIAVQTTGSELYLSGATFPDDGHRLADLYQRACQRRVSLRPAHPRGQPSRS
ncbi:response regulator [Nodosilinea sp. LEGE 07298]|uniref:response regulator n=1 Tax=Nodosilinea sp. LEGE 07298 TaxID=2777970 RepID=UPI00188248A7|nr:response regulator [Nodosilinea sp. LEGE 07298]MBE9110477.1 response regulator [Nodosilinea sp. LEGE 07298]